MSASRFARFESRSRFTPGAQIGHASPELADWEGTITTDGRGDYWSARYGGDFYVQWTAGLDGEGKPLAGSKPGWIAETAITPAGKCPDCQTAAHYVQAANGYGRPAGWVHDSPGLEGTCRG